jgi:hypothetical protein
MGAIVTSLNPPHYKALPGFNFYSGAKAKAQGMLFSLFWCLDKYHFLKREKKLSWMGSRHQ